MIHQMRVSVVVVALGTFPIHKVTEQNTVLALSFRQKLFKTPVLTFLSMTIAGQRFLFACVLLPFIITFPQTNGNSNEQVGRGDLLQVGLQCESRTPKMNYARVFVDVQGDSPWDFLTISCKCIGNLSLWFCSCHTDKFVTKETPQSVSHWQVQIGDLTNQLPILLQHKSETPVCP